MQHNLMLTMLLSNIFRLIAEKKQIEASSSKLRKSLENRINELEDELETARRQMDATVCGAAVKKDKIDEEICKIEHEIDKEKENEKVC
jgi:septal ring factor EnvC (AmiA/AmiB activator)